MNQSRVLWARSETIGCAVNPAAGGSGMMEYWNVGMLGFIGMGSIFVRMARISS
ncbi:hypothetical protein D1AOALGA4SA_8379 [Olavius algarvensis Delta 1 endosymbiont]|nr:hypothetical protein D1AOALGA4SA_8379 [Olavius algarvensis Delta 1 endosymbiont]